ncbi:hypothetical protein [Actinoplanes sp. NPDC049265]|uniref:hypothetical protein n=1 Tax=Actinoplanes sp. NPDC049265 TaxID=3363902 RepID=UPI0037198EF0
MTRNYSFEQRNWPPARWIGVDLGFIEIVTTAAHSSSGAPGVDADNVGPATVQYDLRNEVL